MLTYREFQDQQRRMFKDYLRGALAHNDWDMHRTAAAIGLPWEDLNMNVIDFGLERPE